MTKTNLPSRLRLTGNETATCDFAEGSRYLLESVIRIASIILAIAPG